MIELVEIRWAGGVPGFRRRVRAGGIDLTTPHPNRVIFTNDPPNTEMVLSGQLGSVLDTAGVFLVSWLNVVKDEAILQSRLRERAQLVAALPGDATVLYEDAGFHVPAYAGRVRDAMADMVDVYSMNEDDMHHHLDREVDLLDAVAYERGLQGGITMASTRFRHGDGFTVQDHEAVGLLPVNPAGARFGADIEARLGPAVRCLPAFALDSAAPATIGVGDSFVGGFIAALAGQ
ncbi:hypothetical protein ACQCSX_17150 [Pseudarthrobacter sp. P1]|uniref:hypothetical protein n=1 Tax=Pseudarthrobacter sp. P1 TaxID=3418418 RepID=UPI003CF0DC8F